MSENVRSASKSLPFLLPSKWTRCRCGERALDEGLRPDREPLLGVGEGEVGGGVLLGHTVRLPVEPGERELGPGDGAEHTAEVGEREREGRVHPAVEHKGVGPRLVVAAADRGMGTKVGDRERTFPTRRLHHGLDPRLGMS